MNFRYVDETGVNNRLNKVNRVAGDLSRNIKRLERRQQHRPSLCTHKQRADTIRYPMDAQVYQPNVVSLLGLE